MPDGTVRAGRGKGETGRRTGVTRQPEKDPRWGPSPTATPLPADPAIQESRRASARAWFESLRDRICAEFEAIEAEAVAAGGEAEAAGGLPRFTYTPWDKAQLAGGTAGSEGGGVSGLMRGRVFAKVGVNVSTVFGRFSPAFAKEIPGAAENPAYFATGISLVAHPANPFVPPVHMNTRHIVTARAWFGGGADLNPIIPIEDDTADFHAALKRSCDAFDHDYYERFSGWCDHYFWLPHRNEPRGVGGIFYDYLDTGDFERDFAFTRAVGTAFLETYPQIVRRRMATPFGPEERAHQLMRRGRYVEFNLLHDRGTRFGLMTGGNTEAILMSLPPEVTW